MKLLVQRLVKIWVEDTYEVDEINEDIIDKAIDYEIDSKSSEILWDTLVDEYEVEVYDENFNLLRRE